MVVYISTNFVDYRASVVDFREERERVRVKWGCT